MKYYKIILSSKVEVLIDEEDYQKFLTLSATGNLIKLKQAVVNPSFVVAIIPVKEKVETRKSVRGYLDPKKNAFVVTEEKDLPVLEDEFSNTKRLE